MTASGAEWAAGFDTANWSSGTVFLQQVCALAEGPHVPFRQHSIASCFAVPVAKQSNGLTSSATASRFTTNWTLRFTAAFSVTT